MLLPAVRTFTVKVPVFPESVTEGTLATWHVAPGATVNRDDALVDIETDKVVLEVVAEASGVLADVTAEEGDTVTSEQEIGAIVVGAGAAAAPAAAPAEAASNDAAGVAGPSARRALAEKGLNAGDVQGSGKDGRVTKEDVAKHTPAAAPAPAAAAPAAAAPSADLAGRSQKRVPMTRLRKTIATRLLEAKQSTAMLTTFNEVNMKPIMDLRKQYKDVFEKAS